MEKHFESVKYDSSGNYIIDHIMGYYHEGKKGSVVITSGGNDIEHLNNVMSIYNKG